jgi:septal ring factor EnvC (AmiA/AmiB activator)
LFTHFEVKNVTKPSEKPSETQSEIEQPESTPPNGPSGRKSILALSVFALGLNAAAAVYTLSPSVIAALNIIQSAQQQHVASLQENSASLQENTALLQQDSTALASLRQSITDERVDVKKISAQITDEHVDVKKISGQISTLIAKVDSLQNAIAPEVTSSIPKGHGRNRLTGMARKRMARHPRPIGPISVGGAPLRFPATKPASES